MKTTMILAAVSILFAAPAFAVDTIPQSKSPGPNFEQHKADIIKRIDGRIARNQEEKVCVQAAANHDAIKVCRDTFKAEVMEQRQKK